MIVIREKKGREDAAIRVKEKENFQIAGPFIKTLGELLFYRLKCFWQVYFFTYRWILHQELEIARAPIPFS